MRTELAEKRAIVERVVKARAAEKSVLESYTDNGLDMPASTKHTNYLDKVGGESSIMRQTRSKNGSPFESLKYY